MALPPFISVVIPAYNEEDHIRGCLRALLHQTYPHDRYEVIVVDDGSLDSTREVISEFPVRLLCQENAGPALARNHGVREAKGDIILFTDADCEPEEHWIEEITKPFTDPRIAGVKGVYRTRQKELAARFAQIEFEDRYDKLRQQEFIDFVDSHSAAFRKEVFEEVGGFDPHFPVANNEDVDISYKIAQKYPMVFRDTAIVYHHHPAALQDYLHLKFLRAYWRMMVYKRYPQKVVSDSYTPQTLKLQILLAFAILMTGAMTPLWAQAFWGLVICSGAFLLTTLPFMKKAWNKDRQIALASPLILFLRSLVFAFGVAAGLLAGNREDLLFPTLLVLTDVVGVSLAYLLAYWQRSAWLAPFLEPFEQSLKLYIGILPIVWGIWILSFGFLGLYRSRRGLSNLIEYLKIIKATGVGVLAVVTLSFFLRFDYSRVFIVLFWVDSMLLNNFTRHFIRNFQRSLYSKGYNNLRTVIVGCGETGRMVYNRMRRHPELGCAVVGFADSPAPTEDLPVGVPYLGGLDELPAIILRENVDEVLLAKPALPHEQVLELISACESTPVNFRLVSDLFDIVARTINLEAAGDIPVVDLSGSPMGPVRRLLKRLIDLVAGGSLLLISLPFWVTIAWLIRRDSAGPVLFAQERVGRDGKRFTLYKFRTMYTEVNPYEDAPLQPSDGRITPMGRKLRRASLDELPQLWNVVKGEMSLVGPRPEMPFKVERYEGWQRKRLSVKPGITGLWQIIGRKELPLSENLEYDFYYIKNQSLLLDLTILLKTIPMVLLGRGAF